MVRPSHEALEIDDEIRNPPATQVKREIIDERPSRESPPGLRNVNAMEEDGSEAGSGRDSKKKTEVETYSELVSRELGKGVHASISAATKKATAKLAENVRSLVSNKKGQRHAAHHRGVRARSFSIGHSAIFSRVGNHTP